MCSASPGPSAGAAAAGAADAAGRLPGGQGSRPSVAEGTGPGAPDTDAGVAELVDAPGLGPGGSNDWVKTNS